MVGGAVAALPLPGRTRASAPLPPLRIPDWFRDAKFGIWAHWGPQCVPEAGDWYGRLMYVQGHPAYRHHLANFGHPSETGFLDIIGRWKAEAWDPAYLLRRYRAAGARYFMAMACHHDNFDLFDSAHHGWNATRVGPKRDIVGTWQRLVRQTDMRFGVSNHASHAWHWWQTAYGYDAEGPRKGRRYDAFQLRKQDGRGTWWDGLDPQSLYTGASFVPPAGIDSITAMNAWHDARDGQWIEDALPQNRAFVANWLARQNDLVDKYRPDLVYFDDHGLPFGPAGMAAVAHYYRQGKAEVVLTAKRLSAAQRSFLVEDVERGFVADIQPQAWQTDTCIGNWHYDRGLYERHGYKSAMTVVQRLCDVVAKNGNLLLSIPIRGDGSIDADEEQILDQLAQWFRTNGKAIYGTRPWRTFGEGPTGPPVGDQNEGDAKPFTAADIRFTVGKQVLNAFFLDWPEGEAAVHSLGRDALPHATIDQVCFQDGRPLRFRRDQAALRLTLPRPRVGEFVPAIALFGRGLV